METFSSSIGSLKTRVFKISRGKTYKIVVHPAELAILEIEDMVFRTNSAVFLPDRLEEDESDTANDKQERVQGLSMLKMVMMYAEKNNQGTKRLLCAGHADPSHTDEYNRTLSGYRASATAALIAGKREVWMDLFKKNKKDGVSTYRDEDIQHLLGWTARTRLWNCDPGSVDGMIGEMTKKAIKKFQTLYSEDESFSDIGKDGVVGEETWGAFFDVLEDEFKNVVEAQLKQSYPDNTPAFDSVRSGIKWYGESGDPLLACTSCGETFPLEDGDRDNYRSQQSRRVECLFIDDGDEIELSCIGGECAGNDCPIYGKNENGMPVIPRVYINPTDAYGNYVKIFIADYLPDESLDECPYSIVWGEGPDESLEETIVGGKIEAVLPEGITEADLTVWTDESRETAAFAIKIEVEKLDPVSTDTGLQQRLNNLGFDAGPVDGEYGLATEEAVRHFQYYAELEVTGEADDVTRAKLLEVYGS